MNLLTIFVGSMLANNILLTDFLGLNSILIIIKKKDVFFVELFIAVMSLLITVIIYFANHYFLEPNNLEYLLPLVAIGFLMLFTSLTTLLIKKHFLHFKEKYTDYLTLLFFSPVTMAIGLFAIEREHTLVQTILYTVASSIGLLIVIYIYSTIKDRMDSSPIIRSLRGIPIALVTISIMAMIFARYIGT